MVQYYNKPYPRAGHAAEGTEKMKTYHTEGVCSTQINFETADGILTQVTFEGGCEGNLKAIGALVQGMRIEDVIEKLKGITCESNPTSCADQLAKALENEQK